MIVAEKSSLLSWLLQRNNSPSLIKNVPVSNCRSRTCRTSCPLSVSWIQQHGKSQSQALRIPERRVRRSPSFAVSSGAARMFSQNGGRTRKRERQGTHRPAPTSGFIAYATNHASSAVIVPTRLLFPSRTRSSSIIFRVNMWLVSIRS